MSKSLVKGSSLVVLLALSSFSGSALADQRLRCESSSGGQVWCQADTRHGVRLVRQYSRAPCYQGDTWGYSRRGIWVSNGCRAEFEVETRRNSGNGDAAAAILGLALIGAAIASENDRDRSGEAYRDGYGGLVIRCESHDQRQQYCPINIRRADVRVRRQLSNATCSFGYSWGHDRRGIWVSNGCRAEFEVFRR